MLREDHINYLIHWVTENNYDEACDTLLQIVNNQAILGSKENIKGSYTCVCFTEAPPKYFDFQSRKYKPFGIRLSKDYVFSNGGRPVIYQPDNEYSLLPKDLRWRHVRYDPPHVDFTWEREWRINADHVFLPVEEALIIVPDEEWAEIFNIKFNEQEWIRYQYECMGYGEILARPPEDLPYEIHFINIT